MGVPTDGPVPAQVEDAGPILNMGAVANALAPHNVPPVEMECDLDGVPTSPEAATLPTVLLAEITIMIDSNVKPPEDCG